MREIRLRTLFIVIFGLFVWGIPAFAHHSFTAEFDGSKLLTLTGTITKTEWVNPHTYLYVDVKDENGKVTNWAVESYPTAMLHKAGVTKAMFGEGQAVTIVVNPAKDGTKSLGALRHIKFQNGDEVNFNNHNDGPPEAPVLIKK